MLQLAVAVPLERAYEQLVATGIVGSLCLILGYAVYKLYQYKEAQRSRQDELYQLLSDKFRSDIHSLHVTYHKELQTLTEQLMSLLRERSLAEAKVTEVLQQLVEVQSDVERTLNRFLDQFGGNLQRKRVTGQ